VIWAAEERPADAADKEAFPGSHVFLAEAALVTGSRRTSTIERLAAAIGTGTAFAWVTDDSPPRITTLAHHQGRVQHGVEVPGGLNIPTGARIEIGRHTARVQGAHIAIDGPGAGTLTYAASEGLDAWVRYFFADGTPPQLTGLRYSLFAPRPPAAEVTVDPSRPFDPTRTHATLGAREEPVPTSLRTRWGTVLTIAPRPPDSRFVLAYDPERREAYWTLDGDWNWASHGTEELALLLGLSGTEFVRAPENSILRFVAGAPAFAPTFSRRPPGNSTYPEPLPLRNSAPGVKEPVTTAWMYVEPPPGELSPACYYSQPDLAGLFHAAGSDPFLRALPLVAAQLPPGAVTPYTSPAGFPAAPYAGLERDGQPEELIRRFETDVLSTTRTQIIHGLSRSTPEGPRGLVSTADRPPSTGAAPTGPTGPSAPTGPTGPVTTAVTPQGLLSTLSPDLGTWRRLVLAQTLDGAQQLVFTQVRDKLREALLANQLFLVVHDIERLRRHCSITYQITDHILRLARAEKLPESALKAVEPLRGRVYENSTYFRNALDQVLCGAYPEARRFFLARAELAQLTVDGWTFDLAAWRWADAEAPTVLIIKFADGDLASLIADRSRWTLPAEFNADDGSEAQKLLLRTLQEAEERVVAEPDLQYFVDTVMAGRGEEAHDSWNGVLFLNPAVPAGALPAEVGALAAGLPSGGVRAHHLGVTLSSFERRGDTISLDDSSLFGLLMYEDKKDLVYTGAAYDFKVLSLKVRFANSAVASFSSQVELLVGQLFNELSTLRDSLRGDNVLLNGTLEHGAYRFVSSVRNHFTITSHVLDFVEISRALLVTAPAESTATRTVTRFVFDGKMGFRSLAVADLFGYGPAAPAGEGGLSYSGLMVSMEFDPADPQATRRLGFISGRTTFDVSGSTARAGSLPRRFPVAPAALHQSEPATEGRTPTPADLGFLPVEFDAVGAPGLAGTLGEVWFGLELTMSFGSPGALAPALGFTGSLLLSWAPGTDEPNVAAGLRLPGSSGTSKALTIMGPLKLDIGALSLLRDGDDYMLRMANVALSFMGLRFPSGGRTNAMLFGNPDPDANSTALGWYAAYAKDAQEPEEKAAAPRLRERADEERRS